MVPAAATPLEDEFIGQLVEENRSRKLTRLMLRRLWKDFRTLNPDLEPQMFMHLINIVLALRKDREPAEHG